MRRGPFGALAASPTMVGAITVLIIVVAVFLAYNANSGLPFVPSYRISAQVPDANTLVPGNEVRIGGVRVGQVEDITPVAQDDGSATARIDLKLDDDVGELPEDSTVIVRARSALGLKYLEIGQGTSEVGIPEGAVLPLSAARPEPVELDEILDTFDEPTRAAVQLNLLEFGNAIAGRGPAINSALGELAPALRRLEPVMRVLGARETQLDRLLRGLEASAAQVAPVAETQGRLFVSLDATFGALADVARPFIQETISRTPETLATATRTLPRIRPFLSNTASLFGELEPGTAALARSTPDLAAAFRIGIPALRKAPKLNRELPPTTAALARFNDDSSVRSALETVTETSSVLTPLLRFVGPAQSVCNYATLLLRNASSLLELNDGLGNRQRFIVFQPPLGPNSEGSPSSGPADGPEEDNFLHVNPYPNTASPGQSPRECEAGNEPFIAGEQVIGNVPGNQGTTTEGQE